MSPLDRPSATGALHDRREAITALGADLRGLPRPVTARITEQQGRKRRVHRTIAAVFFVPAPERARALFPRRRDPA